jgi:predicted amidohydrolase
VWENPNQNLAIINDWLIEKEEIPNIVVLPEMFLTGFTMKPSRIEKLINNNTLEQLKQLSDKYNTSFCGSLPWKEGGNWNNRYFHIDSTGIIATYDKKHLFKLTNEDVRYKAGEKSIIYTYKDWKIKPLICFDLRFPITSYSGYSDIIIYMANWPISRIEHWNALLKARAIENQCYVIGVNRVGRDNNRLYYNGQSALYSFTGEELLNLEDNQDFKTTALDKKEMEDYRLNFPFKE